MIGGRQNRAYLRVPVLVVVVGGAAGHRLALVVVRVVDLLPADLDRAVLLVLGVGRAELGRRALVVAGLGVRPAVGLVLGLAVGPVLELLGRVALLELAHLLLGLLELFLVLLGLVGGFALCHDEDVPPGEIREAISPRSRMAPAKPAAAFDRR